jgi:hypothetical protein
MQTVLIVAAAIAVLTGIVHSVLGERLIFSQLRQGTFVPALGAPPLRARNVRILWATWHLASVFGWAFAAVLFGMAASPEAPIKQLVVQAIVVANAGGSILVLVGTRGRHPGWVALGTVAVLTWVAAGGV